MTDTHSARPADHRPAHTSDHAVEMELPRIPGFVALAIGLVVLVLLAALFFLGWSPHARKLAAADSGAALAANAKPVVDVVTAKPSKKDDVLLLPADVRPNQATSIFARTSGYLKALPEGIDIGAKVQQGQLIAEIAAPELDAELDQARASLEQAKLSVLRAQEQFALNQSTLNRYQAAIEHHAVADQELDERRTQQSVGESMLKEAQASQAAAEAAVKRLAELQAFEKVAAPFPGVLTARGYDAGALIKGDANTERPLFRLEQTDVLRVSVSVPQSEVANIKLGQSADLLVRNFPDRAFPGAVARWAASLNPATRTMAVEVDVPNTDGLLLPGMYGQVRFRLTRESPLLRLPTSSLTYGAGGVRVAVVQDGIARYKPVTLGRDFGSEVEILDGISDRDQIINNPGDLKDGAAVLLR